MADESKTGRSGERRGGYPGGSLKDKSLPKVPASWVKKPVQPVVKKPA